MELLHFQHFSYQIYGCLKKKCNYTQTVACELGNCRFNLMDFSSIFFVKVVKAKQQNFD